MALVVDGQLDNLAETILSDIEAVVNAYDPAVIPDAALGRARRKELIKILCRDMYQYVVDQIEVYGIKTELDAGNRLIESYVAGVGSNSGALNSATGGPVTGSVKDSKSDAATQNNDGTGHVA